MSWLEIHIPWEIWLALGLALVFVVHRYFGLKAAAATAVAALLFIIRTQGKQQGWNQREEKGQKDAQKFINDANAIRNESLRNSELHPDKLRDNDGFRRD